MLCRRKNRKMKEKILWISPYVPYDKVAHAGGKNHNYYLKFFNKSNQFETHLISLCKKSELNLLDLESYGISNSIYESDKNIVLITLRKILNVESVLNPINRYGGLLKNYTIFLLKNLIRRYYKKNKESHPDYIILQWTQASFLLPYLKRKFPDSIYVCIEEDVSFQGFIRKMEGEKAPLSKLIFKIRTEILRKNEIKILTKADIVVTLNAKDTALLRENGINSKRIFTSTVYFDDYYKVNRNYEELSCDILFYGAMNREENYLSVLWFIENVMPSLRGTKVTLYVIGNRPHECLKKFECEQIKILGYVEDISEYFANCLCLVAPLVLGAGIKVKVLEAFSAGVPVLTNNIGIEGIEGIDNVHYFHCETIDDYKNSIVRLIDNKDLNKKIGTNAKSLIREKFSINSKLNQLINKMRLIRSTNKNENGY